MIEFCGLLEYANYYKQCKDIVDEILRNNNKFPICIISCFQVISDFLQIYRENLNWFISSNDCDTQSILELYNFMSKDFIIIECIYKNIIEYFMKKLDENTLESHELISHLYQLLSDIVNDEFCIKSSTMMKLFLSIIQPYFDLLDQWIFDGNLIDPFKEFFIIEINETCIWRKYILCKEKIPIFLMDDDIAQSILINGKSVQILRNLYRKSNKGNMFIPCKPFSSSFQYFSSILSKYYPLKSISTETEAIANVSIEKKELDAVKMMIWINDSNINSDIYNNKYNDKSRIYIPFQHIFKAQLLPKIENYCFGINRLLLDNINLLPHLIQLKLFYFIKASDILNNTFLTSLINILSSIGWSKQLRISDALQISMQDSMLRHKLPIKRINVEWTSINDMNENNDNNDNHNNDQYLVSIILQISKLFFNLNIEWPLNIVIKPSIIYSYNRIFKFLLQLKTSKIILETIDIEIRRKFKIIKDIYNDDVIHKFLMFKYKLLMFVNMFNNYCFLQIDDKKWNKLINDIMNECIGLDEICIKHQQFIQQTLQNLFLPINEKQKDPISCHIIHLLLCCDDIQKCWNQEMSEYLQFKSEIINIKQTSLFQHEKNKFWRLQQSALKQISLIDVKFDRLYKFCLVTIDKIKKKSLSHNAINIELHLDFNNFYTQTLL